MALKSVLGDAATCGLRVTRDGDHLFRGIVISRFAAS